MVRVIGWVFSLLGFATLANMLLSSQWTGPTMGAGGNLGALCEGLLHLHFATAGSFIFATSVLIAGLLLCTDYLLVQFLILVGLVTVDKTVGRQLQRRRDRAESSVKSPKSKGRGKSGKREIPIRIGGRDRRAFYGDQVDPDEDEHGWVELDEEAYDDDEFEDQDEHDLYDQQDDDEFDEDEELADEDDAALSNTSVSDDQSADVSDQKSAKRSGKRRSLLPIRKPTDKEEAREEVIAQLEEASRHDEQRSYDLPPTSLLIEPESFSYEKQEKEIRRKARILEKTFKDFGLNVKVVDVETGPVIAQYEIELEAGLRLSKITGLADDLAIALRVPSVRIVAPIPGKNTVGIEVPNEERQTVRLREVMEKSNGRIKKMGIPLFLGKDVSGNPLTVDLSSLPHLLIAGRTGTGKSVCLNAIISSILMTRRPDEVRMLMIDPKMVELSGYRTLPHLMHPVVTDMRKAEAILAWAVDKMEERYQLLAQAGVRHMAVYNQLGEEELLERLQPETDEDRDAIPRQLPYIVIVADEMADLMMTAGKEVEQHIIRLAQKSRAVGIHLILATQKPTVDVITGLIKSNLPARIAFQVASRTDSRVVLDEMGADKLLGNGDMLFLWPGTSSLLRGQGTYLDDDEINSVVEFVSTGEQNFVKELVQLKVERPGENNGEQRKEDPLYDSAVEIVIREGRGSVSLLQRNLGIGYGRAARLIDYMAEDGIVGTYAGSQAARSAHESGRLGGSASGRNTRATHLGRAFRAQTPRRSAARFQQG
ncbi:MAG: DNA translocase FtsK [Pirellulaceae bacterium]